ncbi:MAG: serine/threonine-protein phosphatase [Deltaproteobacteria bacterium]|nr:serine/threonine-protein phosphatase [Deltaproteobacteria bacterium]
MKTTGYYHSVVGGREQNEDSYLSDDSLGLYAVADGIGGGLKGEVASKMAVDGLRTHCQERNSLRDIFKVLQEEILNEANETLGGALMGTTLSCVEINEDKATICHVGDSRVYFFDGQVLRQMTEDQEFYDDHIKATVLNSYLGLDSDIHPLRISQETLTVASGQRFLIASDGLFKQMNDMRIVTLIRENLTTPQKLVELLCDEASMVEHSDNVTVVYVEISA